MDYILIPRIVLALATILYVPILANILFPRLKRIYFAMAGFLASLSLLLPALSSLQVFLFIPWLAVTFFLAFIGYKRGLIWLFDQMDCFLINVGCMYLAIGGLWFSSIAFKFDFLGFSEPFKTLTALHFHYSSFIFPVSIGLIAKNLHQIVKPSPVFKFAAFVYPLSIILVAIGINGVRSVEVIAVVLLNLSAIYLLFYIIKRGHFGLLIFPLLLGSIGILFSLCYTFAFEPFVTLDVMAMTHGLINSLILTPALVYLAIKSSSKVELERFIPFSKLFPNGRVGANFFEEHRDLSAKVPTGFVRDFSVFKLINLNPAIIDFYENTINYELEVRAQQSWWFKILWTIFWGPIFESIGQLSLPSSNKLMAGKIVALDSGKDGRPSPVGWVRTDKATDRAVYVAAYSSHLKDAYTYMNIAFPLPRSHMTSILHVSKEGENLRLSSLPIELRGGDQGVYFVTKFLAMRLPLNEVITVSSIQGKLQAKHEMWFLGLRYLTLDYEMIRI